MILPTFGHISIQLLDSSWPHIEALLLWVLALPLDGCVAERFLVPRLALLVRRKEIVLVVVLAIALVARR